MEGAWLVAVQVVAVVGLVALQMVEVAAGALLLGLVVPVVAEATLALVAARALLVGVAVPVDSTKSRANFPSNLYRHAM